MHLQKAQWLSRILWHPPDEHLRGPHPGSQVTSLNQTRTPKQTQCQENQYLHLWRQTSSRWLPSRWCSTIITALARHASAKHLAELDGRPLTISPVIQLLVGNLNEHQSGVVSPSLNSAFKVSA